MIKNTNVFYAYTSIINLFNNVINVNHKHVVNSTFNKIYLILLCYSEYEIMYSKDNRICEYSHDISRMIVNVTFILLVFVIVRLKNNPHRQKLNAQIG